MGGFRLTLARFVLICILFVIVSLFIFNYQLLNLQTALSGFPSSSEEHGLGLVSNLKSQRGSRWLSQHNIGHLGNTDTSKSHHHNVLGKSKRSTDHPGKSPSLYLINRPSLCSGVRNLTFLVVVHTAIENFHKRHGIRHTWANPKHYKAFTMRTVYFVGRTQNQSLQALIDSESLKHQDIIQGDFIDAYRNMTYKGLLVLNWISEFCNQAKLIIKVDDDVFVNMFTVFQSYLSVLSTKTRQIMCEVVLNGRIRRDNSEKWAVSLGEFSGRNFYPTYCRGYLVLLTPDLVNMMLDKVKSYSFFWIDDVYLFGLLTETLNVHWHDIKARIAWSTDKCLSSFTRKTQSYNPADCCLGVTGWEEMFKIWTTALRHLPESNRAILS